MSASEDRIRSAVQALLDELGDGWHIAQFVVAMGLERVNSDGELEAIPWYWAPRSQPDWMTGGLLNDALDIRHSTPVDDD